MQAEPRSSAPGPLRPERSGHERSRVGRDLIGGGGGHKHQIQLPRVEARALQRQGPGPGGQVAQSLPFLSPRARGCARALADPILVDAYVLGDFGIGHPAVGNCHRHGPQGGAALPDVTRWL